MCSQACDYDKARCCLTPLKVVGAVVQHHPGALQHVKQKASVLQVHSCAWQTWRRLKVGRSNEPHRLLRMHYQHLPGAALEGAASVAAVCHACKQLLCKGGLCAAALLA